MISIINKETFELIVCTDKTTAASFMGVSIYVFNQLKTEHNNYIINKHFEITKSNRNNKPFKTF